MNEIRNINKNRLYLVFRIFFFDEASKDKNEIFTKRKTHCEHGLVTPKFDYNIFFFFAFWNPTSTPSEIYNIKEEAVKIIDSLYDRHRENKHGPNSDEKAEQSKKKWIFGAMHIALQRVGTKRPFGWIWLSDQIFANYVWKPLHYFRRFVLFMPLLFFSFAFFARACFVKMPAYHFEFIRRCHCYVSHIACSISRKRAKRKKNVISMSLFNYLLMYGHWVESVKFCYFIFASFFWYIAWSGFFSWPINKPKLWKAMCLLSNAFVIILAINVYLAWCVQIIFKSIYRMCVF